MLFRSLNNPNLRARIGEEILKDHNFGKPMELDLAVVYEWALFVSNLPDKAFLDFFRLGIENDLKQFSNAPDTYHWNTTPEIMLEADRKSFPQRLLQRKHDLPHDLAAFYSKVAGGIGEKLDLPSRPNYSAIAEDLIAKLRERDRKLADNARDLDRLPRGSQPDLSLPTSYEGFLVLGRISKLHNQRKASRPRILEKLSTRLKALREARQDRREINAISHALENLAALSTCMYEPGFNLSQVINLNRFFMPGWIRAPHDHCVVDRAARESEPDR